MHRFRNRLAGFPWCFAVVCILCLFQGGCGGCRNDDANNPPDAKLDDNSGEKPDEKPKDRFTSLPVVLYPGEFQEESRRNRFKPGHLATASMRVTSNLADANGQLQSYGVSTGGAALPITGTGMMVQSRRPVTLAKEEPKNLETLVYLPHRDLIASNTSVRMQLLANSGLPMIDVTQGVIALKPWQYHVVVLSNRPDELKYLQMIDCVQIPAFDTDPPPPFYHLVRPTRDDPVPLSSTAMGWTTTAYLVWDGFDPDRLNDSQRQALLDWLHFGGQIVINGPGSLTGLQSSFLADWLPATQDGARNLVSDDLVELNANWSLERGVGGPRKYSLDIPDNSPLLGVQLKLNPGAAVVPGTAGLVAERRVGRGRIVVTGFSLKDPRLKKWPSLSSFFNGALLRKPPRKFSRGNLEQVSFAWEAPLGTFDSTVGSGLRMLSRDLNRPSGQVLANEDMLDDGQSRFVPTRRYAGMTDFANPFERSPETLPVVVEAPDGQNGLPDSGVCGWNDEAGIAAAARATISTAAGIRPPSRQFVIRMLAVYLVVLVPLNWLFFWLIGRVEWAWIAAPIIAVAAAVTVIRLASLDIGFARSQTRVGLLEVYGGYSRGHLSEYSALYTSLTTHYDMEFDDGEGVAMPFRGYSAMSDVGPLIPVNLERTVVSRMTGFPVKSNSTKMLHAEMFLDIGGAIGLETSEENALKLVNGSDYKLVNAGIVRCNQDGTVDFSRVGDLSAGDSMDLVFEARQPDKLYDFWHVIPEFTSMGVYAGGVWDRATNNAVSIPLIDAVAIAPVDDQDRMVFRNSLVRSLNRGNDQLVDDDSRLVGKELFQETLTRFGFTGELYGTGVGELFDVVEKQLKLLPGQMRLIAEIREPVGHHQLQPAATQSTESTLAIVHLQSASLPPARPDLNALQDFLAAPDQDRWLKQIEEFDAEQGDGSDPDTDTDGAANMDAAIDKDSAIDSGG